VQKDKENETHTKIQREGLHFKSWLKRKKHHFISTLKTSVKTGRSFFELKKYLNLIYKLDWNIFLHLCIYHVYYIWMIINNITKKTDFQKVILFIFSKITIIFDFFQLTGTILFSQQSIFSTSSWRDGWVESFSFVLKVASTVIEVRKCT
jgi:hypothetical protein